MRSVFWRRIPRWMSWPRHFTIASRWTGPSISSSRPLRVPQLVCWKRLRRMRVVVRFLRWGMLWMLQSNWVARQPLWSIHWVRLRQCGFRDGTFFRFFHRLRRLQSPARWISPIFPWNSFRPRIWSGKPWKRQPRKLTRDLRGSGTIRICRDVVSRLRPSPDFGLQWLLKKYPETMTWMRCWQRFDRDAKKTWSVVW